MLYPKIGIRPTIDGRWGGIRESLEAQTMGLAQAAQTLISSLRYPDGTPVQAVISPCTIGGGAEAARCEEYFATQNVIATLTVTPCWCYGMETFDMNPHTIKAVWGFNGTERPGAVYLAVSYKHLDVYKRQTRKGQESHPPETTRGLCDLQSHIQVTRLR